MKAETFKITELRQLAQHMARARLEELAITVQGTSVRMRFSTISSPELSEVPQNEVDHLPNQSVEAEPLQPIFAQGPGHFLRQHPAHSHDYITTGVTVKSGDLVGVVKMGRIYLPLYSHIDGEVVEVMATESIVEYGQAVILIKSNPPEFRA